MLEMCTEYYKEHEASPNTTARVSEVTWKG